MKYLKYIFLSLLTATIFTSCETYGDYDVEYTSIKQLSGQYRIYVYDSSGKEILKNYCYIANTVDYDTNRCWIRIGAYNANPTNEWAINGKVDCDVKNLTFSGSNIENLAGNVTQSSTTFSVSDGKVVLDGTETPSKTIADAISFTFTNSLFPGETFTAKGYRYTGWGED